MITIKLDDVFGGTVEVKGVRMSLIVLKELLNHPPADCLISVKRIGETLEFSTYRTPEQAAKFFQRTTITSEP